MFTELAGSVLLLGTLPPPHVPAPPPTTVPCVHTKKEVVVATCSFLQGKGQLLTDVSVGHSGARG